MQNDNNKNNDTQLELFKIIQNTYNSFYVITLNKKGNLLMGGDFDGNMFLYNNLNLMKSYKYHKKFIITLKFSNSGKYLASGSADCNIGRIEFDGIEQVQFRLLSHHTAYVMKVDFSPNENYLITAGSDKQLLVFNSQSCELLSKYYFPYGLNFVQFINHTKLFIYGTFGPINLNNFPEIMKNEKMKSLQYQIKQVSLINSVSNSQLFLVNGQKRSKIYLVNQVNFKILRRFITKYQHDVMHLHLSNSKAIFTTSENIEIVDWMTAKLLHILDSCTSMGTSIVSEDGVYLYTISRNSIKIWVLKK
ncbi:unnamed protein product [Paramecium primaurelia]|uniref:Uncharacterized protein n=1 Tax=Paramecium primaurelia TaxID=5886 RepID=A0A8S1QHJ2_PARPR|nr:unnamed protein product [Paramecium primaurelia]